MVDGRRRPRERIVGADYDLARATFRDEMTQAFAVKTSESKNICFRHSLGFFVSVFVQLAGNATQP